MYVALIGKSLAFRRGARTWILYSSEDVQLDSNRTASNHAGGHTRNCHESVTKSRHESVTKPCHHSCQESVTKNRHESVTKHCHHT